MHWTVGRAGGQEQFSRCEGRCSLFAFAKRGQVIVPLLRLPSPVLAMQDDVGVDGMALISSKRNGKLAFVTMRASFTSLSQPMILKRSPRLLLLAAAAIATILGDP